MVVEEPSVQRRIIRHATMLPLDGRRSILRGDLLMDGGSIAAIGGVAGVVTKKGGRGPGERRFGCGMESYGLCCCPFIHPLLVLGT